MKWERAEADVWKSEDRRYRIQRWYAYDHGNRVRQYAPFSCSDVSSDYEPIYRAPGDQNPCLSLAEAKSLCEDHARRMAL